MNDKSIILGAGATGLSVALESGLPVYESSSSPGGICSSYYLSRDGKDRSSRRRADEDDYRFELGGGHWLFGGDDETLRFIETLTPTKSYVRKSSVWFPDSWSFVPYPIQFHLSHLPPDLKERAMKDLESSANGGDLTLREYLEHRFGPTLARHFFVPFHKAYTAGLLDSIAPQDDFKSPLNLDLVRQGYNGEPVATGYNVTFRYPDKGLGTLFQRIAEQCDVRYSHTVTSIDVKSKVLRFSNSHEVRYESIISTLPLSAMEWLTGLGGAKKADPHTSVLVINIGGIKGRNCPEDHWIYVPNSRSGFHRVGFYSNVDTDFLPSSLRDKNRVSLYVEQAFVGETRLLDVDQRSQAVVDELVGWQFLAKAEVVHPTWVDVAYTWTYPGSRWRQNLIRDLESPSIRQGGRYARWKFQGIVDSIREGREVGRQVRAHAQ